METDKEMTDVLKQDFIALNETNRKGVIEMTKFLVLTQNSIIPDFLGESGNGKKNCKHLDVLSNKTETYIH